MLVFTGQLDDVDHSPGITSDGCVVRFVIGGGQLNTRQHACGSIMIVALNLISLDVFVLEGLNVSKRPAVDSRVFVYQIVSLFAVPLGNEKVDICMCHMGE